MSQRDWLAIDAGTAPMVRAHELRFAWERFLDGDEDDAANVREAITDSWRRSHAAGVDPTGGRLAPVITDEAETHDRWAGHALATAAPLIHDCLSAIADEQGYLIVISDAAGHWRDHCTRRMSDPGHRRRFGTDRHAGRRDGDRPGCRRRRHRQRTRALVLSGRGSDRGRRRVAARAQRHEGRAAEHQGDGAARGEPKIVAARLLPSDDWKSILAGDDERLLAELKPRIGQRHGRRDRGAQRLLPRPGSHVDGDSISVHCRHP